MKRTLLAVGVAVLISVMFVPYNGSYTWHGPFLSTKHRDPIMWDSFILQTIFLAVLVNIPWRRRKP
jgi:hypothetical protein